MKRDGKPTKREIELGKMRRAGYEGDKHGYVRCMVERHTASFAALNAAWRAGEAMRSKETLTPTEAS